jgi:AcrR family transcriptional regulator
MVMNYCESAMEATEAVSPRSSTAGAPDAGERILDAAYDLFCARGVHIVGIDEIIATSDVARQTLYRRFRSKQDLVLAVLARREQLWLRGWLQAEVERRAAEPDERLLTIFEVFDEWFHRPGFEGCAFINVMLEHPDADDPVRQACVRYLAEIRELLASYAAGAGIADPKGFARRWHILMKGSIVAAGEGDLEAALRARQIGALVLEHEPRTG